MMKIDLMCGVCLKQLNEKGITNLSHLDNVPVPFNELSDNGIYQVVCDKGHICEVILDNQKFELLFELGINAIIDGYYRDAIISITSSLERFYEFFIKVLWRKSGIDFLEIEKIWKNIASQSERQFGAFIALYVKENNVLPPLLNTQTETKLRNEVAHKGYIPTKIEAIKYADSVLNLIKIPLANLKLSSEQSLIETFKYYSPVKLAKEKKRENDDLFITNILTTIDVIHDSEDDRAGDINHQLTRIERGRLPKKMHLYETLPPRNWHPSDGDIDKAENYIKKAEAFEDKGDLIKAKKLLDKSLFYVKHNYGAIKAKIRIGLSIGEPIEKLESDIYDFIELGPSNPTVCADLIMLFENCNRIEEVINIMKAAERKYNSDLEAKGNFNFHLGTVMMLENNKKASLNFFKIAKKSFSNCLPKDHEVFDVIKENINLLG